MPEVRAYSTNTVDQKKISNIDDIGKKNPSLISRIGHVFAFIIGKVISFLIYPFSKIFHRVQKFFPRVENSSVVKVGNSLIAKTAPKAAERTERIEETRKSFLYELYKETELTIQDDYESYQKWDTYINIMFYIWCALFTTNNLLHLKKLNRSCGIIMISWKASMIWI